MFSSHMHIMHILHSLKQINAQYVWRKHNRTNHEICGIAADQVMLQIKGDLMPTEKRYSARGY